MGQVAGKKGAGGDSTGMTQKEQKAVIQDFRKGLFNVLVHCRIPWLYRLLHHASSVL